MRTPTPGNFRSVSAASPRSSRSLASRLLISKSRSRILMLDSCTSATPEYGCTTPARQIIRERVDRIDHHALGRARVGALAEERDGRQSRTPRLIADLAERAPVDPI